MDDNGASLSLSSSSSMMLIPLPLLTPDYHGGDSSLNRQLAVLPPTTATALFSSTASQFKLPPGWAVKKVLRSDGSRVDKLLRLDEEEFDNHQLAVVAPTTAAATSPFILPDGWVVEEVPRSRNGKTDKYYYEPGTGRQFRSLVAVERYLEEMGDENAPLSHVFKLGCHVKNSGPRKKICREEVKTSTFDSDIPPAKVNWVLADSGGDTWNAFMGESVVPESVTQQWANRFMLSINDNNFAAPNFEW
ncbi:methyl-CpG-binding domain-containing protein 7-like isoform X3 [Camellia sinensis]|uniref:methyl-CpG-binding domain-containing protein 7-like isoform X3 n=1 Tax=Camellia sinensis TaxID=4442 RepID=UPI001036ABF5|nr:methyl-CpG-binding domain-containing protein 7-like isoform X3 [Camellia sinensis]